MWNYAELAKHASDLGGPEVFMDSLVQDGIKKGRLEMLPVTILAVIVSGTVGFGIHKAVISYKEKMKKVDEDISTTKESVLERFLNEKPI